MITAGVVIYTASLILLLGSMGSMTDAVVEMNPAKFARNRRGITYFLFGILTGTVLIVGGVNI